jgi:hypothetical protein
MEETQLVCADESEIKPEVEIPPSPLQKHEMQDTK